MGDRVGNILSTGERFTKIWRMRNEGTSPWAENTALTFVGGDQLGAPESVLVPAVGPGEEIDIPVDMVAPSVPGRYVSYWRLCTDGQRFGHRIWVDVIVREQSPSQAEPIPALPQVDVPQVMVQPVSIEEQPIQPHQPILNPSELLELEFEHMTVAADPQPALQPEQPQAPQPELEAAPQPEPQVVPIPEAVEAPQAVDAYITPAEAESITTLRDMGFQGDLLGVLRRNKGELLEAVREILGN